MRLAHRALVAAALALAACSSKTPEAAPAAAPSAPAAGALAGTFSLRDLALATAFDARLARFSLLASDLETALAQAGPKRASDRGAKDAPRGGLVVVSDVPAARAEVELAAEAIANPADRPQAARAAAAAKAYSGKLMAAVGADRAAAAPEIFAARDAFGAAISEYRASRSRRRLDAPEPQGVEREFADARREAERVESAFGSRTRVAPREEGHEFDPATARMTGLMAARRAGEAAEKLPTALRGPAVQYAAAEERALDAVTGLAQAPEAERAALARRYHAAKADALAALADYYAALSTR